MSLTAEQDCFHDLARDVWEKIGEAKRLKLAFQEETITETLLLQLAKSFPGHIAVLPFSKTQEGRNGADWAWCVESADRSTSLTALVQAKRLNARETRYSGLGQRIGRKVGHNDLQIDRLIATAANYRIPPVYAFYNGLTDRSRIDRRCPSLVDPDPDAQIEAWGISIASAHNVRANLHDTRFERHYSHSVPLHCLFCAGGLPSYPGGLPALAARGLRLLHTEGPMSRDPDIYRAEERAPSFVAMAREFCDAGSGRAAPAKLGREFPGIAGVILMREAPRSSIDRDTHPLEKDR
jgi:hypothetical protein